MKFQLLATAYNGLKMRTARLALALMLACSTGQGFAQSGASDQSVGVTRSAGDSAIAKDKATAELSELDKRALWSATDPDPKTPAGRYFHKGYRLQKRHRLDQAIPAYKKAVSLEPKMLPAYYDLGLCLESQEKWGEAEAAFEKVIQLSRLWPLGYKHLAFVCFKQGKDQEGRAYIHRFLGL